jgi:hypothetical protein
MKIKEGKMLKEKGARQKKTECVVEQCYDIVKTRGLCHKCYQYASKLVRRGLVTWEDLEKRGKSLPRKRLSRMSWFMEGVED